MLGPGGRAAPVRLLRASGEAPAQEDEVPGEEERERQGAVEEQRERPSRKLRAAESLAFPNR